MAATATAGDGALHFKGYGVKCVFGCKGQDQMPSYFGDANSLRKHHGRVHNIWRAKARTQIKTCPSCLKGFDYKKDYEAHERDAKKCARVKCGKWKTEPAPGSQMHIDVFALKGTWDYISPHLKVRVDDHGQPLYERDETLLPDPRGQASGQGAVSVTGYYNNGQSTAGFSTANVTAPVTYGPRDMQQASLHFGQHQQHPQAFLAYYGAHDQAPIWGPSGQMGTEYGGVTQPPTLPMLPAPFAANSGYGAIPLGQPQYFLPPAPAMPVQQPQACAPAAWEDPWARDFLRQNPGSDALVDAVLSGSRPLEQGIAMPWAAASAPPTPPAPAMAYPPHLLPAQTAPQWCSDNFIGATHAAAPETQPQGPSIAGSAADTSQRGSFSSSDARVSTPPSPMVSLQDLALAEPSQGGNGDDLVGAPGMLQPSYASSEDHYVGSPSSWLSSLQDFAPVEMSELERGSNFPNPMEGYVPATPEMNVTLEPATADTDARWTVRLQPLFGWNAQH